MSNFPRITKKRVFYLFVGVVLFISIHFRPPHSGVVRDAETQEPLSDVVAFLELRYKCYFPPNPAGTSSELLGFQEAVSNQGGVYKFPVKIYFKPPLLCFTDKYYKYFKVGYFESRDPKKSGQVELYKLTHYLNFLAYRDPEIQYQAFYTDALWDSSLFKVTLSRMRTMDIDAADERGIFLRLDSRKFTRIYRRAKEYGSHFGREVYYVLDERSGEWVIIDCRARRVELSEPNIPKWDFMDSNPGRIFATKNTIFYPVGENPRPMGMEYTEGEIRYITPHIGNISDLQGTVLNFLTIEGNGDYLCHYGDHVEKSYYSKEPTGDKFLPYFLKCFKGADLPRSKDDETIDHSEFKFLSWSDGPLVVTKSKTHWHIYSFVTRYDEAIKNVRLSIVEMAAFPANKEITAIAHGGGAYFLAFKDEGIRKYHYYQERSGVYRFNEDSIFNTNSRAALNSDVRSLLVGYAGNIFAVYATTGEDKIYRFSLDGVPDFIIRNAPSPR